MKGNPALRTLLVLLLLGAVLLPMRRVIFPAPSRPTAPVQAITEAKTNSLTGTLNIKAAPTPLSLTVGSLGKTLLTSSDMNSPGIYSKEITVATGSDLIIHAEWADDRPHALRAEFLPDGGPPVSRDCWGGRTLEDTLSLP